MPDHKYGRLQPNYLKPRLWLEDYLTPHSWPKFSAVVDRASAVQNWPMYLNDSLGDCTVAGMGHMYGALTQYAQNKEAIFEDSMIQQTYFRITGGADSGAEMSSVLEDQYTNGMQDMFGATHKVAAFAQLKLVGPRWLACALTAFGSVYVGVNLPQSAETQFESGQPWTYVQGSPIIGGHAIVLQAVDENPTYPANSGPDSFTYITWGSKVTASWQWCSTYIEEAWVAISDDWLQANGTTISGFDLAQLQADMSYVNSLGVKK